MGVASGLAAGSNRTGQPHVISMPSLRSVQFEHLRCTQLRPSHEGVLFVKAVVFVSPQVLFVPPHCSASCASVL